ncbi:hypothetical protein TRICI_006349 [Trichomonascus ciferrii]|uniref:Uncharacterized protein n=1 Tax=Trichomonascus ciferrii TaxID=44093 RepID=A0A642UI25_9ASCO|nr:hypothetical protein TRICI_006349 [Trichomonascus ciferrii]
MAENFGSLLRTSRLASLSKPLKGVNRKLNPHPSHQVVATTPASFHRRDWGLKAPIPEKHRSLYVNVQAMDSPEGIAQYEAGSGFYRKLQRFRELGVPLKHGNMQVDYFLTRSDQGKTLLDIPKHELERLMKIAPEKRKEFKKFLEQKRSTQTIKTRDDMDSYAAEFWNFNPIHAHSMRKSRSSIGLNYGLKGTLHNTPDGMRTGKIVPGRVVNGGIENRAVGIAGFVAESSHRRMGAQDSPLAVRDVQQFLIRSAEADTPCRVRIQASSVQH